MSKLFLLSAKKLFVIAVFAVVSFVFSFNIASAATYYVDNVCSNNGDGTSQTCAAGVGQAGPFNSIANMLAKDGGYSGGDNVYLKKGEVFREKITVPSSSSGTIGNPVTFGAYGSGNNPLINGSDIVLNPSFTKTVGQTIVYQASWTIPANIQAGGMVWEDSIRLTIQTSIADVNSNPGSFYYSAGTIYVSASDSSDIAVNSKTYEVPRVTDNVVAHPRNYVTFDSIDSTKTWGDDTTYGGYKVSGTGVIGQNINSYNHRRHSYQILDCTGCILQNSDLSDSAVTTAVSVFKSSSAYVSTGNIVRNNIIHDSDGLLIAHGTSATYELLNTTISGNNFYNSTRTNSNGVTFYSANGIDFGNGNYAHGTLASGTNFIYVPSTALNVRIFNNKFDLSQFATNADALLFSGAVGVSVSGNTFAGSHNRTAVRYYNSSTNGTVKNNLGSGVYRFVQVDTASQTGFVSDNNNIYSSTYFGAINSTNYSYSAWQTALGGCPATGKDCSSFTADPQFVSVSDYNLRYGSPAIDTGTTTSQTTDYAGNPIYGTPDIGAYEYQPTYTMGTSNLDITGSVRLYGNGKWRYTTATTSGAIADINITPVGGSYPSTDYSEYLNYSVSIWNTSGNYTKTWTESSSYATSTVHTIGDMLPNTAYTFKLDGTASTTAIIDNSYCTSGVCTADSNGDIQFTYRGGYSTHTFSLVDVIAPTLTETTPVTTYTTDTTPSYVFQSNEAGTILYAGSCSSNTTSITKDTDTTITFTTLSDGVYSNCQISVIDPSGNNSATTTLATFYVDTTNPSGTLSSPSGDISNGSPSFSWSGTDTTSGVSSYSVYIDNVSVYGGINTSYLPSTSYSCGQHTWYVSVTDNAQNTANSPTNTFTVVCGGGSAVGFYGVVVEQPKTEPIKQTTSITTPTLTNTSTSNTNKNTSPSVSAPVSIAQVKLSTLKFGKSHNEISNIQKILNKDPDTRVSNKGAGSPGKETKYYGTATKQAIIKFQEKYAKEILSPLKLKKGTGIVGPATMKKLREVGETSL